MTGNWQFGSPVEHNPMHAFSKSPGLGSLSPVSSNHLTGLASILPPHVSNSPKIAPIGKDQGRFSQTNQIYNNTASSQGAAYQHSHSFTDQKLSTSPGPISFGESNSNPSGIGTLSGPQFLWGSPTPYPELSNSSAWPISSGSRTFSSNGQGQGFPYNRHGSFIGSSHHHVGSAPSGVPLDRHFGYFPESPETSFVSPVAFGGVGLNRNNGNYMVNIGGRTALTAGVGLPGNITETGSPSFRMLSLPKPGSVFLGNGSYVGSPSTSGEGLVERGRSRRIENNGNLDSKKQYQLDLDKIISGEDTRTTLMIKNIPNK